MSTTPEYGEEKLVSGRERRIEERSNRVVPAEDNEDEQEVGEHAERTASCERSNQRTMRPAPRVRSVSAAAC